MQTPSLSGSKQTPVTASEGFTSVGSCSDHAEDATAALSQFSLASDTESNPYGQVRLQALFSIINAVSTNNLC